VCCSAEVALVERLLAPIDGVRAVTVVVPSRTVIVVHDADATPPAQIGTEPNRSSSPSSCHRCAIRQFLAAGCSSDIQKKNSPLCLACSCWGIFAVRAGSLKK
jgi:Cd2+/Zn2+-exporting ATPase